MNFPQENKVVQRPCRSVLLPSYRGNQSIYLHRSGPLLENGLDRPKNRYGRYGFPSFYRISISTVGVDGSRSLPLKIIFSVVADISQFPVVFFATTVVK